MNSVAAHAALIGRLVLGGYGRSRFGSAGLVSIAIAASVALAVSLEMAARSVRSDLEATATALSGRADLRVAGGSPIPEALLETLRRIEGVAAADPIGIEEFRIAGGPHDGVPLHVVGIDLLSESPVHDVSRAGGRLEGQDLLALVAEPNALVVTDAFRDRMSVGIGDAIEVHGPRGRLRFTVRGVLEGSDLGRAYGSQVAVMDVYALQALVGRNGYLDAISIAVDPNADSGRVEAAIAAACRGIAGVKPAGMQHDALVRSMGIVEFGVGVMVAVGIGVAVLLAYGTATLSTERRAGEFAVLRIAGVEARRVRWVVLGDGLLVGALGTLAGIPAGIALARWTMDAFSGMTTFLGVGGVEPAAPSWRTLGLGVATGLAVSTLGTLLPARRAAKLRPLEALQANRVSRPQPARNLGAAAVGLAAALGALAPLGMPAAFRIGLVVLASIAGIRAALQIGLPRLLRRTARALERALPGVGYLVGIAASARPAQAAVAVTAVAALLGTIGAISIVVTSIAISVDEYLQRGSSGASLRPGNPLTMESQSIGRETIERVRAVPGVLEIAELSSTSMIYRGRDVIVVSVEFAPYTRRLPAADYRRKKDVYDRLRAGQIRVSEAFARQLGAEIGEAIRLDTPAGGRDFHIAQIAPDFNPAPTIVMDQATFARHWPRLPVERLRVWTEEPEQPVLDAIVAAVADIQPLFATNQQQMARWGSDVAARFRGLLDAVAFLVAALGGVAVLNLLATSIVERRREFGLLHASGVSRRQIAAAVACDALALACLGALCGVGVALWLAGPMLATVEETFAWTLTRHTPWAELGALTLGVVAIATLAGMLPVYAVMRLDSSGALASD